MKDFFTKLQPFLFLGILLVILVFGLILLSYILLAGAAVGLILFILAWIKTKFSSPPKTLAKPQSRIGKTFEHDDKHEP